MTTGRNYRSLILFFILISFLVMPTSGAQIRPEVLLDGTGIFIESGDSWEFSQGYVFVVKDVNEDGGAWVELSLDGALLKDVILQEGDVFVYSRDSNEIFNMTVDTIYYGSDAELVTFRPVYQYRDIALPAPLPDESDNSSNESDVPSIPDVTPDENIPGFGILMSLLSLTSIFICSRFFINK
ncbi:S-layer protein domain-containing protein [Methanococcoides sp. LMO-2]|uniref:S-layer protein domain-containing protein n=1 Tax=Methanococcoides cohabitans TaxID=3136559 RepID=A0ABU9KS29_9EURY